jgi:putative Holliday junction resolvase
MRAVAFDVGERRTGVALSDPSGALARPWRTLQGGEPEAALAIVTALLAEEDGLDLIVVGLPKRLDGSPTQLTPRALAFAEALRRCGLPVVLQDERLTSVEAESRLATRERDWRKRKARLDAATAAVILQDYLDQQPRPGLLTSERGPHAAGQPDPEGPARGGGAVPLADVPSPHSRS